MRRALFVLAIAVTAVAFIAGCSGARDGVFESYQVNTTTEQVPAGKALSFGGKTSGFGPAPTTTTRFKSTMTGKALIKVGNAQVLAKCAFQGLKKGQKVQVKMSDSGDWAVVSVQ